MSITRGTKDYQVILLKSWRTSNSTITLEEFHRRGIPNAHKYVPNAHEIKPPYQKDFVLPTTNLSVVTDTKLYGEYHNTPLEAFEPGQQAKKAKQTLCSEDEYSGTSDHSLISTTTFNEASGEEMDPLEPELQMETTKGANIPTPLFSVPSDEYEFWEPEVVLENSRHGENTRMHCSEEEFNSPGPEYRSNFQGFSSEIQNEENSPKRWTEEEFNQFDPDCFHDLIEYDPEYQTTTDVTYENNNYNPLEARNSVGINRDQEKKNKMTDIRTFFADFDPMEPDSEC